MTDMFIEWQMDSWQNALQLARHLPENWIFRGQSESDWGLTTSLERYAVAPGYDSIWTRRDGEQAMLNEFKRHGLLVLKMGTDSLDDLDWLALLQHHGGVTRLLDFTRSFYIGTFFTVEKQSQDKQSVLWAINRQYIGAWLEEMVIQRKFQDVSDADFSGTFHHGNPHSSISRKVANNVLQEKESFSVGILEVSPWHFNERLSVQQGVFLFPLEVSRGFAFHLWRTINASDEFPRGQHKSFEALVGLLLDKNAPAVLKITIPWNLKHEIMHDLRRMNITAASLYPGIDGFARSLNFLASGCRAMDATAQVTDR
jgi:hypothetical protein